MHQLRSSWPTPLLAGSGFLGGFLRLSGLLGRFVVIFDPPELVVSLKNTMMISSNDSDESYIQKKIG